MNKNKRAKINWYSKKYGITLISLVITIVIMLILAGVAISITVGDGSVTQHAQNATEQWNAKVNEEQSEIDKALGYLGIEPATQISDQMPAGKGWDNSATGPVDKVATQSGKIAPIPKGYTVSQVPGEGSISGGMVVYQIPTGATVDWENNQITLSGESTAKNLQENVNQYVWIPVDDINDMVMCKYNNKTTKIDGTAIEDGICELEYDVETNEIICKTHGFDTTGYDTTENVLAKTNLDTVGLAGRLYGTNSSTTDTAAPKIYTTSMDFTTTSQTFSANSDYREPAIVTDNSSGTGTSYDGEGSNLTGIGDGTVATFKAQLNKDFIEMAKSVAKYGGFYVSRYEAGANGASLKNQKVLVAGTSAATNHNPDTYINGNKWYGMYNTLMSSTAIDKTAVNSHMIWGCQYDQIIKFLSENSINEPQIGHTARQLNAQKLTGETTTDIMSNIFDLEGNNREWTAQANNTYYRVLRGGNFNNVARYSDFSPASSRGGLYPTNANCNFASRSVLYVK